MESSPVAKIMKLEDPAVTNFREYLRIKTVPPNHDYDGAVKFLIRMAKELKLPYQVVNVLPNRPVFLMSWLGTNPALPSILLNSHIDVVPVFPEHWDYDPFSADKDAAGNIYARGSQDMKCVGIQYIEAVRKLMANGKQFPRTVHFSFVPDEETGGHEGMQLLVKRPEFKNLNVGFALDEGLANPTDAFKAYYGERSPWWVQVVCTGDPGHGSRFIENSAAKKLQSVINSFMSFRDSEEARLKKDPKLSLGDVTTTNMNMISGGVQMNVVPSEMVASFDIRIAPTVDLVKFEQQISQWCEDAGEGVSFKFLQKNTNQKISSIDRKDPWWNAFMTCCESLNLNIEPEIFPAATDSRYLRELDIPAIGFSPMNNTPVLLHDHNEYLSEEVFLTGIQHYMHIIPALASVSEF